MRITLYSDAQVHPYATFSKLDSNGVNDRLMDHIKALYQILDYTKSNNIHYIVFAGDLFESRTKIDVVAAKLFADWRQEVAKYNISILNLVGNHDRPDKSSTLNSLSIFFDEKVIDQPMWYTFGDDSAIYFVPYMDRLETVRKALAPQAINEVKTTHNIAIIHYGLRDVHLESGAIIKGNQEEEGAIDLEDLKYLLQKCKHIFFGHYHSNIDVTPQVHFIGTLLQHNWGEKNIRGRFLDIDITTGVIKEVPTTAPRFVEIDWVPDLDLSTKPIKGNFVRVSVPNTEIQTIIKQQLTERGARGIDVPLLPAPKKYHNTLGLNLAMSFESMGEKMVDSDSTILDKQRLKTVMSELLKQAAESKL